MTVSLVSMPAAAAASVVVIMVMVVRRGAGTPAGGGLVRRGGTRGGRAAAEADAVVDALEEAGGVAVGGDGGLGAAAGGVLAAVEGVGEGGGGPGPSTVVAPAVAVAAGLVDAELGLDGGAVDAVGVEALTGLLGELHVALAALVGDGEGNLDVHGGDELGVGQLPHVHVVAADDAGEVLDVLADLRELEVVGRRLQQHLGRRARQRDRRPQDDERDEQRHCRVSIQLARPVREPDDERRSDDTDVAQRVAQHVQDHRVHAHVSMAVPVRAAALARFRLRLVVVVFRVNPGIAPGALRDACVGMRVMAVSARDGAVAAGVSVADDQR